MADIPKELSARFYRTKGDKEPVRIWLKALGAEDRKTIGKDIQKVEFGWPIGLPVCRPRGQGLWEVRSDITSSRIARVLFCVTEGQMVLLHGFIKKSQKTPKPDMDLAVKRKREVEQ